MALCPESYLLSDSALLGFGFTSVIVTFTLSTVSLLFNALAKLCKAFSLLNDYTKIVHSSTMKVLQLLRKTSMMVFVNNENQSISIITKDRHLAKIDMYPLYWANR